MKLKIVKLGWIFILSLSFGIQAFAGEKTLVIGDSHSSCYKGASSNYVTQLRKCIKEHGSEFLSLARSSAAPSHYTGKWPFKNYCRVDNSGQVRTMGGSPNFQKQVSQYDPDHVVVTLGDNVLGYSHSSIVSQYKKLIGVINEKRKRRCTLVTPTLPTTGRTYNKTQTQLNKVIAAIKEAAGDDCKVIDSTKLLPTRMAGDGVHLRPSGYNQWGQAVCSKLYQQEASLATPVETQEQETNLEGFFSPVSL